MIFSRSRRKGCRLSIEVVHTTMQIPTEIWDEIFSRLPLKSLLRFSSASKSWNSIIHQPRFIKKYSGHKRIVLSTFDSYSLSSILSHNPIEEKAAKLVCPFYPSDRPLSLLKIKAYCDGLFCVQECTKNSLFLWNPCIQSYRQLPNPLLPNWETLNLDFSYGLGYDAVADDYKLLNISDREVMLYSLRCNSWRRIQSFPHSGNYLSLSCFVRGTLHWICTYYNVIVSFDLSTEEYGKVPLPPDYPYSSRSTCSLANVSVTVLMGKLCLSLNYWEERRFVVWVMAEYGVVESWTKKLDIDYGSLIYGPTNRHSSRPLNVCEYGDIVISVPISQEGKRWVILTNTDGETVARRSFRWGTFDAVRGLVFVESLVSPAMWPPPVPA